MPTEKTLSLVRMSEVRLQEVKWLWKPYIPFEKLTIIQGDPGEGKTTLALRLAAACSSGTALPGMEIAQPFNVIYQTAEDGLGVVNSQIKIATLQSALSALQKTDDNGSLLHCCILLFCRV